METVRECFKLFVNCLDIDDNFDENIEKYNIDEIKNKSHALYMKYIIKHDMFSTDSRVAKAYGHLINIIEDVRKDMYDILTNNINQLKEEKEELLKDNNLYKTSFFFEPQIIKVEDPPKARYRKPGWLTF